MSFIITKFETTPNPNALKCWLNRPVSEGPRSFLNASMAADDELARALFEEAGATCVLFNGDWLTVNKSSEANWSTVKGRIKSVLEQANT